VGFFAAWELLPLADELQKELFGAGVRLERF
jgi:hypothetical protein